MKRATFGRLLWILVAFLIGIVVGVGAVISVEHIRSNIQLSLFRTKGSELWNAYRLWVEAGKPSGAELAEFAKGFKEWKLLEKDITIEGSTYRTLFCAQDGSSDPYGTLYVTRDGVVISEGKFAVLFEKKIP